MTSISAVLRTLINGQSDVCCLCLNAIHEDPIRLSDDVVINLNNEACDTAVEKVLNLVFDKRMYNYITSFNTICEQCVKLAVSYYKFIQTSQTNAEYLKNVLSEITNSVEYTTNDYDRSKSLFVSLNLQDFTSKHYYDMERPPTTVKGALKRFQSLDQIQHLKFEQMQQNKIKKEDSTGRTTRKRPNVNIPTSDMIDESNSKIIKCKECLKKFQTTWNLRNHYIRIHAPKKFKCKECSRSYGSLGYLEAHRKQSHCTVVCSQCGKTFYNRHTLRMHELGHYLTVVCQDCGRVYKNKTTFKKHIEQNVCGRKTRAHPSEAKFTCDYCNKKYSQKMSLRVHIQYEHGNYKGHKCEWCGKMFWAQSRLKAHIVKHTKEKNFPCTICNGKFVSKESLLYHTRTHTGETPYNCPHCEYKFVSASRRSDHVRRHHLGGTLECDICYNKFTTTRYLQKHKKTHIKVNDKTNLNYNISKSKSKYTAQSKSIITKQNLYPDIASSSGVTIPFKDHEKLSEEALFYLI